MHTILRFQHVFFSFSRCVPPVIGFPVDPVVLPRLRQSFMSGLPSPRCRVKVLEPGSRRWDFQDGNWQAGRWEEEFTTGGGTSKMGTGR